MSKSNARFKKGVSVTENTKLVQYLLWETLPLAAHQLFVGALVLLYILAGKIIERRLTTGFLNSFRHCSG